MFKRSSIYIYLCTCIYIGIYQNIFNFVAITKLVWIRYIGKSYMIIPGPPWPFVFCPVESAWWSSGFNNSHLVINWYTYVIVILWNALTRTWGVGLNTRYNTVYVVYAGSKRQTDLRYSTNNSKFSRSGGCRV